MKKTSNGKKMDYCMVVYYVWLNFVVTVRKKIKFL